MVFGRGGRFNRVLDPVEMDRFDPAEDESVAMFSLDDDGALTAKNSAAQDHMDQLNETELISLIRGLYLNKSGKGGGKLRSKGSKDQSQSQGSSLTRFFRGNNSKGSRHHAKDERRRQEKRDDSRHRRRNSSPHQVESFEYLNERDRCPPRDINVQQQQPYQPGYYPVINPYAGCGGGFVRVPPGYGYRVPPPPGYGYPRPIRPPPPPGMYNVPYPPQQLRPIPANLPYYNNSNNHRYNNNDDRRRSDNRSTRSNKSSQSNKSSRSNESNKSRKSVRREALRRFLQEQHELASLALAKHAKNNDGQLVELEGSKRYKSSSSRKTKHQQPNDTNDGRRYDEIAELLKDDNNKNTTTSSDSSGCCGCCGAGTWNPFCCLPRIICMDGKYCVFVCR